MRYDADDGGTPDFVGARDRVLDGLIAFAEALRARGAAVPANAAIDAARALVEVGFDDREAVRAATRATLVSRTEDLETFERLFPAFWARLAERGGDLDVAQPYDDAPPALAVPTVDPGAEEAEEATDDGDDGDGLRTVSTRLEPSPGESPTGDEEGESAAVYSPGGRSEPVSGGLALAGPDEALERPMRRLTAALAALQGRRWGRAGDRRVDARRALRGSFGTGGTVVSVPTRDRKRTAVSALLLVDVSQSVLDTIDRGFLLRFLRRACAEWRSVRVFFFDTSVMEVTDAFQQPTPEAALATLERAEAAWGGGTRIGRALDAVRREHPDAVDRDTTALVVSDGLEVGEIDLLESGMSWLAGRAGTVLWCNPLAASPEYEPTCRGMAAALPYVDGLFAFAGPEDLAEMARQLERRGPGGPIGYEFDARERA